MGNSDFRCIGLWVLMWELMEVCVVCIIYGGKEVIIFDSVVVVFFKV